MTLHWLQTEIAATLGMGAIAAMAMTPTTGDRHRKFTPPMICTIGICILVTNLIISIHAVIGIASNACLYLYSWQ